MFVSLIHKWFKLNNFDNNRGEWRKVDSFSEIRTEGLQINLHYRSLEARRSAKMEDDPSVKYAFSIYLGEAVNTLGGNALLPFIIDVETRPEGAFFKIKGEIFVRGPQGVVKKWTAPEDGGPPRIWSQVYCETLKLLSSLADYIHVPPPNGMKKEAGRQLVIR